MQVEAGRGRQPSCSPLAATSLYLKLFIFKHLGPCTEADAVTVSVTTSWPVIGGLYLFHEVWTLPFLPTPFLLLIKPNFISEQSIFPEQKAQMLHLDKAETKPLFCQKYPFHFSFCPASHQIKSTLTNIVTHPRSTFFGKQSVRYKKHHPAPSVCHKHTGRGAGASRSPSLTVSTALPAHPGTDSPNELSQPLSHHCYWWLCACFSCALVGSNLPSLQELLLQPGAAHAQPNAQPFRKHFSTWLCTGREHRERVWSHGAPGWGLSLPLAMHLQSCCTRDTRSHLSCSPVQFNYQLGSSPAKYKKSTHCSCLGVSLPC